MAGAKEAAADTAITVTSTPISVTKSVADTPYSMLANSRVNAIASANPTVQPSPETRRPCARNWRTTSLRRAPKAMRIPVLAGEPCRYEENVSTAMVNRSFADRYLNGGEAIGRHLMQAGYDFVPPAVIRGIVGDAREMGLDRPPAPTVYMCAGAMQPGSFFLLRTRAEPASLAGAVRRKVHELEPAAGSIWLGKRVLPKSSRAMLARACALRSSVRCRGTLIFLEPFSASWSMMRL